MLKKIGKTPVRLGFFPQIPLPPDPQPSVAADSAHRPHILFFKVFIFFPQ